MADAFDGTCFCDAGAGCDTSSLSMLLELVNTPSKLSVLLITPSLPILSFLVLASPPRLKVGPIHSLLRCDVTIRRYVAWMAGGHSPIFIYLSISINQDFAKAAGASVIDKR